MSQTAGGERAPSWGCSSSEHTALLCSDGWVSEQHQPAYHSALPQAFFFHLYGMILRECPCVEQVQCHLASLLDLSHQHSIQREVGQDIVVLCLRTSSRPSCPIQHHCGIVWLSLHGTFHQLSAIPDPGRQPLWENRPQRTGRGPVMSLVGCLTRVLWCTGHCTGCGPGLHQALGGGMGPVGSPGPYQVSAFSCF